MTNKVNMEEIIAYNMKAKSYCPYDLSVLRMPINICTEEQSFLTYESWRCFFTAKDLQEAWPVLKSALKEYGISCALDLDHCSSWRLRKFKCPNLLCHILEHSCTFVFKAVKVLNGMPCYLVYTGISMFSGKKLLMSLPVQELEKLTCCNIYLCPEVAVVEDCIVHNMPPAPRVRRLANYIQAIKGVEALRL
ncbi:hypothetical protein PRUPE_6G351800 [Prunus persica]|uniref:Uncharacterized protein n=1 Tax=Prunus persica TaxID=3760 RepID=A0A251P077_PRUPE|nr:hypothetical protein PRUPE_6G351800 [Prunus persica]ONI05018.1 hypothetical protein PRUPE_6G351800 [Prunus persica]